MAEPTRETDRDINPDIRPDLGPTQVRDRRDLSAINNQESNPQPLSNNSVSEQEQDPSSGIPGPWNTAVSGSKNSKVSFIARMSGKKKWLASGGIGVGLLSIPVIFLALMPLKLEMFIKNITGIASAVPGYATEQRLNYLVTRALATRLLMAADGKNEADGKLVFCASGGIACSLFATYSNDYFEKRLGITIDVTPNGRTQLGGKATSWNVGFDKSESKNMQGPLKLLQSNAEMKSLIKAEVTNKTKNSQIITRFLARKLLMKKFGVTTWRGPPKLEKTVNSFTEAKLNLKTSLIKNTTGKISPRLATYLTCLQGDTAVCTNLRSVLSKDIAIPNNPDDDPTLDKNSDEYKTQKSRYDAKTKAKAAISGISVEKDVADGAVKKIITKKIITAVGGVGAVAGILDLIFGAIGSVDDGALEEIWYDMSAQTYTGLSTDILTINDKMKAGDLDADTIAAAFELFEDAESSPLYQAESGLSVDTSSGITTPCGGVDGEKINTKLEPGELVCSDQRMVRDYSSAFTNTPGWSQLADTATAWNNTVGVAFDFAGDAIGAALGAIPGFNQLMSFAGGAIEPVISWMVGLIFEPPFVGSEASGPDNYTGLSAGIRTEQNALFEEGVDTDGTAMGGGGTVLNDQDLAMVTSEYNNGEKDYFNNQPLLARIFSTDLTGSFAQRFLSKLPISMNSLAGLPMNSMSQFLSGNYAMAATDNNALNPFNLPIYGYASGDPMLSQDPSVYTEDSCKASAAARIASRKLDKSISMVAVYTVADPCALEKMVVGSALNAEGVTDDKYSLKAPTAASTSAASSPTQATGQAALPVAPGYGISSIFNDPNYTGAGKPHKGTDFSNYAGGSLGKPVYAVRDGLVISAGKGGCDNNNTVTIQHSDGTETGYMHMLGSEITVTKGDKVTTGQQIGKINNCGDSSGAHLHFQVAPGSNTESWVTSLKKVTKYGQIWLDPVEYMAHFGVTI